MIQESASAVLSAIRTIENERQGLKALAEAVRTAGKGGLGPTFSQAVEKIEASEGAGNTYVKYLAEFLRTTQRGVIRPEPLAGS